MVAGCYYVHLSLVTVRKPVLGLAVAQECKTRGGTARRRGARVAPVDQRAHALASIWDADAGFLQVATCQHAPAALPLALGNQRRRSSEARRSSCQLRLEEEREV